MLVKSPGMVRYEVLRVTRERPPPPQIATMSNNGNARYALTIMPRNLIRRAAANTIVGAGGAALPSPATRVMESLCDGVPSAELFKSINRDGRACFGLLRNDDHTRSASHICSPSQWLHRVLRIARRVEWGDLQGRGRGNNARQGPRDHNRPRPATTTEAKATPRIRSHSPPPETFPKLPQTRAANALASGRLPWPPRGLTYGIPGWHRE